MISITSEEFKKRLSARLVRAELVLTDEVLALLEAYYRLLERWNAKINLTSLRLDNPSDETFDRLFVEALTAARHVPEAGIVWFDLGSGGGSPAIPLKILRPRSRLVLVESRSRKAAFLREVVRTLGLTDVHVENTRFEEIAQEARNTAQMVTVRAVRVDEGLFGVVRRLLAKHGRLLLFRSETVQVPEDFVVRHDSPEGLQYVETEEAAETIPRAGPTQELTILEYVPRGTK